MRRRSFMVVVSLALTLAGASCGGGDDSDAVRASSGSTSTTSTTSTSTTITDVAASPDAVAGVGAPTSAPPASATTVRPSPTTAAPPPTTGAPTAPTTSPPTTTAATTTTTTTSPPPAPGTAAVSIRNFTFSPPLLRVDPGATVTATNFDGTTHTWTADDARWDSGNLAQDGSFSRAFPQTGSFPYHCSIHPSMKGTVVVDG